MDESLCQLIDHIKKSAETFVDHGEDVGSVMFLYNKDGAGSLVNIDGISSDLFPLVIRTILAEENPDAYLTIGEAWATKLSIESESHQKLMSGEIRVRDLPPDDKYEAVILICVIKHEPAIVWEAKVLDNDGHRFLSNWENLGSGCQNSGRRIIPEW